MLLYLVCVLVAILLPCVQFVQCSSSKCANPDLFHFHTYRARSRRDLPCAADNITNELPWIADDHGDRWSYGSVSTRLEKAIWLLGQSRKGIEEKGVSQEQLENLRRSLEQVKRTLDLMGVAKEKVWEGIQKAKWVFISA